ncbi:hypothetical protein CR513_19267, partial [Mucuna pruriens]
MLVNHREVRRVLLAKREPLFVVPTNMLLHALSSVTSVPGDKCVFCTPEVTFLGFVVSSHGVKVNVEKVKAIQDWPTPKNNRGNKELP